MPQLTEMRVTYSTGVKANIGNYESADAHLSRGETWNVTDLTPEQVQEFYKGRFEALKEELSTQVNAEYRELKA